ncbi:MAG: hypothetical protein ABWY62_00440 [Acidimicrobiia bacterium]
MTDRRVYFFLGAALVVVAIYPFTPAQYRWVAASVAVIYVVFAVLFAVSSISTERAARRNGPR